jgi:hypothetical protein
MNPSKMIKNSPISLIFVHFPNTAKKKNKMFHCQEFTMDSYVAQIESNPAHTTIIFTLRGKLLILHSLFDDITVFLEEPGALAETLKVFKQRRVNLTHIESRPSKVHSGCYEFMVECAEDSDPDKLEEIIRLFRRRAESAGLSNPTVHDHNSQVRLNRGE